MKKQVLAWFLAIVLLISFMPQSFYAAEIGSEEIAAAVNAEENTTAADAEAEHQLEAAVPEENTDVNADTVEADVNTEAETENPAESQEAAPTETPAATPTETPSETPTEVPGETPAENDPAQQEGTAENQETVPEDTVLPEEGILAEEEVLQTVTYVDIPDGYYMISSKLNENRVITVHGYSRENNANVKIYDNTRNAGQIFKFEGKEETVGGETRKYYIIRDYNNLDEVLDVENSKNEDKTNVQQYKEHNAKAQRWYVVEDRNGYYSIRSAVSGATPTKVLETAKNANSSNVYINTYNGKNFQLWKLTEVKPYEPAEGVYTININATKKAMDVAGNVGEVGTNIDAYVLNGTSAQQFYVKSVGYGGYYKIISQSTRNGVAVKGNSKADGTNIELAAESNAAAQIFRFEDTGKKTNGQTVFNIIARNGAVLGVTTGNVQINGAKQDWYLTKVTDEQTVSGVGAGFYYIIPKGNTGLAMGISDASLDDGARAELAKRKVVNAQRFKLSYITDGYMKLQNIQSGKMLSVKNGERSNGTAVRQWSNSDSYAIKWKLLPTGDGDGSFYLQFYDTGYQLNLDGSAAVDTKMEIRSKSNTTSQKFYLMKTTTTTGWQTYMGLERKVYDGKGNYYKNTTVDGKKLGADGTPTETWIFYQGFWRYRLNGKYVDDTRPYLGTLYPMTTKYSGYSEPDVPGYYATLDRTKCLVTIYTKYPGSSSWNLPVCAFKCSPGRDETPTDAGIRYTLSRNRWSELMGPSYGQYTTRLSIPGTHSDSGELFHSIPGTQKNDHNVSIGTYNALGTKQSHGCVRMAVRNCYWIYRFCWLNMMVNVGDYLAMPIHSVPQPCMSGGNVDPTDPAYTGNYGYVDTNVYYGHYYFR